MDAAHADIEKKVVKHPNQGARFVSAKAAAAYVDYTPDYISRLAREGKVVAEQRGRSWYISLESLKLFSLQQAEEQRTRQQALKEQRLREYATKQSAVSSRRASTQLQTQALSAALAAGAVGMCLLVVGALGWTVVREELQLAQLYRGAEAVLSELGQVFAVPFSDDATDATDAPAAVDAAVPANQVRIIDGVLVVQEGASLRNAFSDPVTVSAVGTTSAILTPVFSPGTDTAYQLEVTPIESL
ncbi:MAG TPA: hypothetical protein VKP88_00530 [Candidatus Paceibacterota bacterium]|nr:hypothetical protein [Candidatus Paceibacterota bacterium]